MGGTVGLLRSGGTNGGGHRASVPNTALGGTSSRYNENEDEEELESRSVTNPDMNSNLNVDPTLYRPNGGQTVVPSLFPRVPTSKSASGSGFGTTLGMPFGIGPSGHKPGSSAFVPVPLSPGSVGPRGPAQRSFPSATGGTGAEATRTSTISSSEKNSDANRGSSSGSASNDKGRVAHDHNVNDPTQQSRWNMMLVQHPHARRASIGDLSPSGLGGRRTGWSASEEDEDEQHQEHVQDDVSNGNKRDEQGGISASRSRPSGSGLKRDVSLRERSAMTSSPTRSIEATSVAPGSESDVAIPTSPAGLRSVSSTETGGIKRSRRPQTSGAALSGTQTQSGRLGSRGDAVSLSGRGEQKQSGSGERRGSISPGTVGNEVADPMKKTGQLAPAMDISATTRSGHSASSLSTGEYQDRAPRPSPARGQSNVTSVGWGHLSSSSGLVSPPAESAGQSGFLGKRSRGTGTGRPGWEGEEVVGVLREDGMPGEFCGARMRFELCLIFTRETRIPIVTTFRSTTQMSRHLRNQSAVEEAAGSGETKTNGASTNPAVPSFANQLSRVLLVPLSDSPTLPSLSLLLAQGTTPSAICFQQDLLDRARRTEADWLPSALQMIGTATRRGSDGSVQHDSDSKERHIHVIAYSANPALAPSVVDECLRAGAIGVLQPPYDNEVTLKKIRRMIMWAERSQEVRRSFDASQEAGLAEQEEVQRSAEAFVRREEQVLEDAAAVPSIVPEAECHDDEGKLEADEPTEAELTTGPAKTLYSHLAAYDFSSRRRSVDNGGLSLALERAYQAAKQNRFKSAADIHAPPPAMTPPIKQDRSSSLAGLEGYLITQQEDPQGDATIIAELLGEMYRQTRISIEIQMIDYAE